MLQAKMKTVSFKFQEVRPNVAWVAVATYDKNRCVQSLERIYRIGRSHVAKVPNLIGFFESLHELIGQCVMSVGYDCYFGTSHCEWGMSQILLKLEAV